jgi:hypothetical protein
MSEVQVPRLIVLSALVIFACARPSPAPQPFVNNPCEKGRPAMSKQQPVVCIDDSARTLVADPDRIVVHDVNAADRVSPVAIQWFTKSGTGDVHVQMAPGCTAVRLKNCNGKGKCDAETIPGARRECKYDVWITGGKHDRLDPTVVVDACCS